MNAGPDDVTAAVLSDVERAANPRTRQLLAAGVRHLHALGRETHLAEVEVVLIAASLGVSSLVCLQNNGSDGEYETAANLMGPCWREGAPPEPDGDSIVRPPTPGDPIFVTGTV